MKPLSTTAKIAWTALVINVITVLGGTLVRATGSGAGCGQSWPSCQGVLVPGMGEMTTRIEFAHRAFSGLALLSVLALVISVYRKYQRGSQARRAARTTALAIIIESLLGAWLVLARLVEDNATVMRAISVPIHLVNTLFLLGALTATAWITTQTRERSFHWSAQDRRRLLLAAGGLIMLGATGAIAALADTLFPAETLTAGLVADFEGKAHFLTRLRLVHPVVAISVSLFLLYTAAAFHERVPKHARMLTLLVCVQLGLGALNVFLLTPIAVQILHLLVADLIWIALVLASAELGSSASSTRPSTDREPCPRGRPSPARRRPQ